MRIFLLTFPFLLSFPFDPVNPVLPADSTRAVRQLHHSYPQQTKRDYRRFMKVYSNRELFEKLVKGKDSSAIRRLIGEGDYLSREVFELTYNFSDADFGYALAYQNRFSRFKVKPEEWYLQQFAIVFNEEGNAYKVFDHETRGSNLFDKKKRKGR